VKIDENLRGRACLARLTNEVGLVFGAMGDVSAPDAID